MAASLSLGCGQKLITRTGSASGRLGFVARHTSTGELFGLTARHVLEAENDDRVYDTATGTLIGRRGARKRPPAIAEFFEAIGSFRIDESLVSVDILDIIVGTKVLPVERCLGLNVYKVEWDGRRIGATVTSIGASIALIDEARSTETVYRQVLEIAFAPGDGDPVIRGEAGSLVVDDRDRAIGLIIAGTRDACYVAPLASFLSERGYVVLEAGTSTRGGQPEDMQEDLSSDLRGAIAGAEILRAELIAEGMSSGDPERDPISQEFVDMVELA